MKTYQSFIFDSYVLNERTGVVLLHYSLDDEIKFTETVELPVDADLKAIDPEALNRSLFALHLIGGISYYKTCLPRKIEIRSGSLNEEQVQFWNTVYENGLGEFFYRNNIDFRGLVNFPLTAARNGRSQHSNAARNGRSHGSSSRILLPVGGGKDSIVTLELLKQDNMKPTLLRMGEHPLIDEIAQIAEVELLTVKRTLSPTLLELNKEGALNGHVPITAYVSFLSLVTALYHGFQAVVMSNERSANEGNVTFHGKEINHQWSKGGEFERMYRSYVEQWITRGVTSFSLLRSLNELTITLLFTQLPQYFEHFSSCNANWKIAPSPSPLPPRGGGIGVRARWCNHCPKCAFVFACLAAFLPRIQLCTIFNVNLFGDATLIPLYRQLLGIEGSKPFECVGTKEETQAAFLLAYERGELSDTAVMRMFVAEVLPGITDKQKLKETALATAPV